MIIGSHMGINTKNHVKKIHGTIPDNLSIIKNICTNPEIIK